MPVLSEDTMESNSHNLQSHLLHEPKETLHINETTAITIEVLINNGN